MEDELDGQPHLVELVSDHRGACGCDPACFLACRWVPSPPGSPGRGTATKVPPAARRRGHHWPRPGFAYDEHEKRWRSPYEVREAAKAAKEMTGGDEVAPQVPCCRHGHLLDPVHMPTSFCDVCDREGTAFRCSAGCDFDLCGPCLEEASQEEDGEEGKAPAIMRHLQMSRTP